MKTINKIKIYLLLSLTIMTVGCDEFLDVNENPNNPQISKPSLTLPVAQADFVSLNGRTMNYLGNYMVYNYSVPSNWSAGQDLLRYNISTTFYETIFTTSYATILKNLHYVENFEDGLKDYSGFKVIASTLKAFQYQYLVDLYGDIPYTEALQREFDITPKYDDAETVYKTLIDNLTANATMALSINAAPTANYEDPLGSDIIFSGNMVEWAKFANTVKLRMLLRLSNTGQDAYIISEIAKITANGAGYVTADVNFNPGYSNDENKQNPLYSYVGRNHEGQFTDRNDYTVASDYIINYLDTRNDPRYLRLYSLSAKGTYKGSEQITTLPGVDFTSNDLSHVGPGLIRSSEQDQPIILAAESNLLQAEAVARGYIAGGMAVAQAFYETGIEDSFVYLGVPDAVNEAIAYYGQAGMDNVNWAASTDKIEAIITQKYIALNGTHAIESWIELTRTGFPSGLPIPAESDGVRPVRLLYPSSEVARNSTNVPSQGQNAAFTDNPFWK